MQWDAETSKMLPNLRRENGTSETTQGKEESKAAALSKVRRVTTNGTKAWVVDGQIMRNRKTLGMRATVVFCERDTFRPLRSISESTPRRSRRVPFHRHKLRRTTIA
jgi:hypothetical protein